MIHVEVPAAAGTAELNVGDGSSGMNALRCRLVPSLPPRALAHVSQLRPGLPRLLLRYTTRVCPGAWR
jgi:hypothetical protein